MRFEKQPPFAASMILSLLTALPSAAATRMQAAAPECEGWNTSEFFEAATVAAVTACLENGADVQGRAENGDTILHLAAGHAEDPAIVEALIAAGADLEARDEAREEGELTTTPLHRAAYLNENPDVTAALLAAGADVGSRADSEEHDFTALHQTAGNKNPAVIDVLVAGGIDVDVLTATGITPLHLAALRGNRAAVERFLAIGADATASLDNGRTALHMMPADAAIGEALLAAGADPNARTSGGLTPLHEAARDAENPAMLEVLITAGADPQARTQDGRTVLHSAAENNENPAIVETLVDAGADPNVRDDRGRTPLHRAVGQSRKLAVIRALLAAGADPNVRDDRGRTPLDEALMWQSEEPAVIRALLAAAADVDLRDEHGWTPLHFASDPEVVQILLAAGADPNARETGGMTPLHSASQTAKDPAVIQALVAGGAKVDTRTVQGKTPLFQAVYFNSDHPEVALALLEAGADPNADTNTLLTIVGYAVQSAPAAVVQALADAGADLSEYLLDFSLLHFAGWNDDPAVAEMLLAAGADPNEHLNPSMNALETPLHFAAGYWNSAVAEVLLAAGADVNARDEDGNVPLHNTVEHPFPSSSKVDRTPTDVIEVLLKAGADGSARNAEGRTPWDVLQQVFADDYEYSGDDLDAKRQELRQSEAYWRLNDARFEAPAGDNRRSQTGNARSTGTNRRPQSRAAEDRDRADCLIPGFPEPDNPEAVGLPWCPASVDFQVRVFALSAAGAQCAIATGSSSTSDQIEARQRETADLCARLDAVAERLGGSECRCPADWR